MPLRCTWLLFSAAALLGACGYDGNPGDPDARPEPDARPDARPPIDAMPVDAMPDAPVPPPETTIETQPDALSASATATITFSSPTQPVAGLTLSFECADDGATEFTACSSPVTRTAQVTGTYSIAVRARWSNGTFDASPSLSNWEVDRTPPQTTIVGGPDGATAPGPAMFTFSSEAGATFECRLDAGAFATCTSPYSITVALGAHTFEVRASDALGNTDETPAQRAFTGDATVVDPPETAITSQPAALSANATATVAFTSPTQPSNGLVLAFECMDETAAAYTDCTSPVTRANLGSGTYSLAVRARWVGGSIDQSPATATWTVDRTPPETTITSGPMGDTPLGAASYVFSSEVGATFQCRLDAAAFAACTSPYAITVAAGSHTFEVRATDALGNLDPTPAARTYNGVVGQPVKVRLMAANTSSGNLQSYDPGHGTRIFQGIKPDIVMIQEFNYRPGNTEADIRAWVTQTFGANFQYYREPGRNIPNGVISRYPILEAGVWDDPITTDREYVYARIDVPGAIDLWAISVHLRTTDSLRPGQATTLVQLINANVPASAYLVIGGDFNTDSRTETCVNTLSQVVSTAGPWPADRNGDTGTNASRGAPYDWLMMDAELRARQVPVVIGASTFANGLVADTRVYSPIAEIAPALAADSGGPMMQHMAIVNDVLLPQ